jgi:hypothetical protein
MTVIIVNPVPPEWVRCGERRPPEWMHRFFPEAWEREFIQFGDPREVGKYFAEETMKQIRENYKEFK